MSDTNPVRDLLLDSPCPACRAPGIVLRTITHDVPHFGEALETLIQCGHCGFRHVDFMITQQKDPVRYTFRIASDEDLRVRVIRSNSGTYRIPEIGFLAEPTSGSESFVSNIEGVITRVIRIFELARSFNSDNPHAVAVADAGLAKLRAVVDGRGEPLTLILEDPHGNSAIVSPSAEKGTLTPEEVEQLHTGIIIIDKSELDDARALE